MSNKKIEPVIPGGFQDFPPEEMIARQKMFESIQRTYENFGFVPLDTSTIEYAEVLLGEGGETDKQVYHVASTNKQGEVDFDTSLLTLRYDLTVPLARFVAANIDKPKFTLPFKRYQLGKVFRGEKPQAGRYREFVQFDADIVGTPSMLADTEIINMMIEALTSLGLKRFIIKINNRKILNGLAELVGIEGTKEVPKQDRIKFMMRILDKLGKVGWDEVTFELTRRPDNDFDPTPSLLPDRLADIRNFLDVQGGDYEKLNSLTRIFKGVDIALCGISELREILDNLKALKVDPSKYCLDLSIARGLDYYTGPVVETELLDLPQIGSVMSGGRFDGLVSRFSEREVPATGASIGVDRLFAAMKELGLVDLVPSTAQVLVTNLDSRQRAHYLSIAGRLRSAGIKTELYFGSRLLLRDQIGYANLKRIPIVIIIGQDEIEKGGMQIKDMNARKQVFVSKEEFIGKVQSILG